MKLFVDWVPQPLRLHNPVTYSCPTWSLEDLDDAQTRRSRSVGVFNFWNEMVRVNNVPLDGQGIGTGEDVKDVY